MFLTLLIACQRPGVSLLEAGETGAQSLRISAEALPACGDPSARNTLGPYSVYSGADWDAQPIAEEEPEAAWGVAVEDFDGDGLYDIFLPNFAQDRLYLGRPGPEFIDASATLLPFEPATPSLSVAAADADGDGAIDLGLGRRGAAALYLNQGDGHMALQPALSTHVADDRNVSWGDLDGDGLPELFIGTFYLLGFPDDPRHNELYHNDGGGRFSDISDLLGPVARNTPANAGGFLDIDRDGDQDLYVVNDKPQAGFLSVLLENDGAGNLRYDENAHGLDVAVQGMGFAAGDLNGDGLDELVITGWSELFLRMSAPDGVWFEAADAMGLRTDEQRVVAWAADFVDIDLDGDLDLLVSYGPDFDEFGTIGGLDVVNPAVQPMGLYINEGGFFVEESAAWGLDTPGIYRGFSVADLNRDGYPDLVVPELMGPARVYLSRCGDGRSLAVNLRMPSPNTRALGARVRVSAGGQVMERTVLSGTTNASSSSPTELLFGLGEAEQVEELEVLWPDGAVSTLTNIAADQVLTLTRPE